MHRSKLVAIAIDCQDGDVVAAAKFWGAALGRAAPSAPNDDDPRYLELGDGSEEVRAFVQRVAEPSAFHIDIETDDVEAEVRRLEKLGARRVKQVRTWWVLEAPTGQRFCVVRPQRGSMPADASVWDEGA